MASVTAAEWREGMVNWRVGALPDEAGYQTGGSRRRPDGGSCIVRG